VKRPVKDVCNMRDRRKLPADLLQGDPVLKAMDRSAKTARDTSKAKIHTRA